MGSELGSDPTFLHHSERTKKVEPSRQSKGAQTSGEHDGIGGEGTLIAQIPGHNKAAGGGSGAKHDKHGHQLVGTVPQKDRHGKKEGHESGVATPAKLECVF